MVRLSAVCGENYFGPQCQTYCKASMGCDGNFVCDPLTGMKDCAPGFTGADCTDIDMTSPDPPFCQPYEDSLGNNTL